MHPVLSGGGGVGGGKNGNVNEDFPVKKKEGRKEGRAGQIKIGNRFRRRAKCQPAAA